MAVPWRERPRDLAGSAITPAATEEVAHATLSLSQPSRRSPRRDRAVREGARNLRRVFIGRRTRLCGSRSRAQGAPRCFARACARLAALTARSADLGWQLSTASREPLDERAATALLSNSLRRLRPATPFTSPDVEHTNRQPQVTIRFSLFTLWSPTRATTRPRRKQSERTALRPQASAPDPSTLQNRHRHAATALRLSVVDASEPHSVLPIHSRTSTRNRHRRSTWAGVSWPNDDGIGAGGGDNIGRTPARTRTTRSTRGVTSICALSSERLPVRRRASSSRRNGSVTPRRFIEARQQ